MGLVEVSLLLLTLRSVGWASAQSTLTNITFPLPSYCQKKCGNISIEYPFGIGNGCHRPGFNLTCTTNHTTNAPRLLLGDGNIEVSEINMEKGFVYIKSQIITMGVEESNSTSSIDFGNSPYSFGLESKFNAPDDYQDLAHSWLYVAGCSVTAYLVDPTTNSTIQSCSTSCSSTNGSMPTYGSGYCIIFLDDVGNLTSFKIELIRVLNQSELGLGNSSTIKAFLLSGDDFTFDDVNGIVNGSSTKIAKAALAWYMNDPPTCKEAEKNNKTYACISQDSECYDAYEYYSETDSRSSLGYFCLCSSSYPGNPYIPNGCQGASIAASPSNDCQKQCGGVDIVFPFGLRKKCYRDESFALRCNETSNPPTLIFGDYYIVQNISLEKGQLELKNQYSFSSYFDLINKTEPFALSEEQYIINWVIEYQSCEDAMKNMKTFACHDPHSKCFNASTASDGHIGYRCKCSDGYEGNPYVGDGCQDINECNSPERYICYGTCINTAGDYSCLCPSGTYGTDPKHKPCIPDKKRTLILALIIGASSASGLFLLCSSFFILRRKWKKRRQKKIREKYFRQNHGLLLQQLISSTEDIAERTKIFSLEEIGKATNNFDETRVLGRGGHGIVYKGILSDQRIVAIKKSKIVKKSEIDQFINEVAILSQINHRNVVKLFGCCLETEVPLLIYEFISNGNLSDHLHILDDNSILSWEDRLRIATEIASALAYLHSAASISIFHRDVKSSNILLDDHFTAKVSDFGASRFIPDDQTHIVTAIQGTFGYLDPEYYQTSQLTEKSDVYSFGIILLELLTGKKPVFSTEHGENLNLSMYFLQAMKENRFFELVEDRVTNEGTKEELIEIIQLIEMCLKLKGIERPTMKEVEYRLQGLRNIRRKKRRHYIAESNEEAEYLLTDVSCASSELSDQAMQGTSRNYSQEKEFLWSHHHAR